MGSVLASALRFRMLLAGLAAVLVVVGVTSVRKMHADAVPELGSGPVLEVQTEALGLSSQEVEQYVTVPLENNLLDGIMGVWDERSHSIPGLSTVDLYFEPGVTTIHARQLVAERLTNAFSLPNVSKPPQLIQPLSTTSRVMMVGLSTKTLDPLQLSYLARWIVRPKLSGVPGVANVAIFGQRDRQLQVLVDPARLAASHHTLSQVIATAGNAQLVSPLNYLQGSAPGTGGFLEGPNQRLDVRPVLPLGAPKNLSSVPLSGGGAQEPLGAVTQVVKGHQPLIGDAVVGHGSGLLLLVQKLPSASTVAVTRGLDRALSELHPALAGVSIDSSIFRPARYVSDGLRNEELGLAIAVLLMGIALAAWLLDVRAAALTLLSSALSLLVAMVVLQALGYTFTPLVALGLLIAIGLVVDDSAGFSAELLRRLRDHHGDGTPTRMIVLDACGQLRGTLAYATLIALLAAAPIFFSKGSSARFVHPMVLALILAVLASMVVAVTLTPALALLLFERGRPRMHQVPLSSRVIALYRRMLRRTLALPVNIPLALCVLGLAGWIALGFIHQPSRPANKDRNLVVQWQGPVGASLNEMDRLTRRVVGSLRALPEVADAGAALGRSISGDRIVDSNSGEVFASLRPQADYDAGLQAVRQVVEGTPGVRASVGTYEDQVTSGVLAPRGHAAVVRVYGQDYGQLRALASHVEARLRDLPGLGRPQLSLPVTEPNIEITVNDAAALRAGVLPGDARRQASTLVSGLTVGNFFQDQAVFDVVVQGVRATRRTPQQVRNLLIDTSGAGHVPLSQIAQVSIRPEPIDIQHQALSRYVDISVPVSGDTIRGARSLIQSRLHGISYPLRYHAEVLGATPDDATSHFTFLSFAFAAAIGLLLLFQAALRNWRLATLLFLVLPVSLVGGLAVSLLSGALTSLGSDVGLLAVFLLAARQGMLQVSHVRLLQARDGGALTPALVMRAAVARFGPAVAANVVIAAALLPFIVSGDAPGNEMTHTAAAVMLGGLLSATALTQLMLPALCLVFGPTTPIEPEEPDEELEIPDFPTSEPLVKGGTQ
jgi:Cu/Ag efflux pump CusA